MPPAAKRAKVKRPGGLSAARWTVNFDATSGAEIRQRSTRQGTKPGVWCREAALERLRRENLEDQDTTPLPVAAAAAPGKR